MKSQENQKNPIAGMLLLVMLLLAIWVFDATFDLPTAVIRAAIFATFISACAVSL